MLKRNSIIPIIAVVIVAGIMIFQVGMGIGKKDQKVNEPQPVEKVIIKDEGGFVSAISSVSGMLMPAVVHIDVTGTAVQRSSEYGNFFGTPQRREIPIRAMGSGVIVSKDGYIITNNHVVQNAESIAVELYDGSRQIAKLVGTDPGTDLAVVKIEPASDMKYARLGISDDIKVGEWVIAIGSPRGLDWTVTAGIISAKNRRDIGALGPSGYEDFIQTDAAINPGNSGGPLINLSGEVIGINSLIVSASQGSEGLGFAIPSNMVKTISESLIKNGKVIRGYFGVNIQDITPQMKKGLKLEENFKGVIIADVLPDGPADKAGLMQGDIITQYDGKNLESAAQLRNSVATTSPGTQIKIKVLRDKEEFDISIRIGDLGKMEKLAKAQGEEDHLGLSVEKVNADIAQRIGLRRPAGVIVTEVQPRSNAENIGIKKGDIIFRVGNRGVNNPQEFNSLISAAAKDGRAMLLLRDGMSGRIGYIVVPLG
jgi:serine protease Do